MCSGTDANVWMSTSQQLLDIHHEPKMSQEVGSEDGLCDLGNGEGPQEPVTIEHEQ